MAYDAQTTYAKHQSCEEGEKPKECGCCPAGLVAVYEDCKHVACLSPNDAELYSNSQKSCAEGYVKLFHPTSGAYLGCVSESEYTTILAAITPAP